MLKAANELSERKYTKLTQLIKAVEERRRQLTDKPDTLSKQVASLLDAYLWR